MLQQLQVVPLCAVAEADMLQEIHIADKIYFFEIFQENRLIATTVHLEAQRVGRAIAQEADIGPEDIFCKLKSVLLRWRKSLEAVIGIFDDIGAVTPLIDISIRTLAAAQIVFTGPAIECVVVEKAIDGIISVGFGIFHDAPDDVAEIEAGAIFENEFFNQIGANVVQPSIAPQRIFEEAEIEPDTAKLPNDLDGVVGFVPLVIEDNDLEVIAVPITDQLEVIGTDITIETQPIEPSLDRPEGECAEFIDHILAVAALEDIEVATGTARQIIVTLAAPQDVGRPRGDIRIIEITSSTRPIDNFQCHPGTVPDDPIGKDDRIDARLKLGSVGQVVIEFAEKLVLNANRVAAIAELQD